MSTILQRALALQSAAESAGVTLRLIGSLAVQLRSPRWDELATRFDRPPSGDIDFVGYMRQRTDIGTLFSTLGFEVDPSVRYSQEYGVKRFIFIEPTSGLTVDVFLDELVMAHTIRFERRLEAHSQTVPLLELLLSKLQIHELTRRDVVDALILLDGHDPLKSIDDLNRFESLMAGDWGFHRTVGENLRTLERAVFEEFGETADFSSRVEPRIAELLAAMDRQPRTLRWQLRALIGTRMRWYEEVAEVH